MIIGITGPTDYLDPRRHRVTSLFRDAKVLCFDDLTSKFLKELTVVDRDLNTYASLLTAGRVEDALRFRAWAREVMTSVNPTLYTDWMAKEISLAFHRDLREENSSKKAQVLVCGIVTPSEMRFVRSFMAPRATKLNKILYCEVKGMPDTELRGEADIVVPDTGVLRDTVVAVTKLKTSWHL